MTAKDLQIREQKDLIAEQKQLIGALNNALKTSNAQTEELTKQVKLLNEQLDYLKKKLFGTSSERRDLISDDQLSIFNEIEFESASKVETPEIEQTVKSHSRKRKTSLLDKIKGISVEQIICDLESEKTCELCGHDLIKIGQEVVRRELEYIPAKVKILEYVSLHYTCPECKETEDSFFAKAPVPQALMKHSLASPSSVAWVMYQKYANGLPLYRQEKDWKQYGISLSRATMANWVIYCALHYLKPLYTYLSKVLLTREVLMADETRVQVLKEDGKAAETDSYMWVYRSGEDSLPPIILFNYTQTRQGKNAAGFLDGYKGYLMTDGYSGYNLLNNVKRCCCWAHIRRYFIDAVPKGHEYDMSIPAVQGVEFCSKLFHLEKQFKDKGYDSEKRKSERLLKEKPIVEAFFTWLDQQVTTRNDRFYKAVQYAQNRRPYLATYLEDGRCSSLSNNLTENTIRPFTIGRKGWLFCDTPKGAEASAIVYSFVEMAKANNLNINKYLTYLLSRLPSYDSDSNFDQFMPWSEDVQDKCKNE